MAINDFRFDNLPRPVQIVLFTGLVILLATAFYFYHLKDQVKKHDALQAEIKKLELSVAQGTAVETRLQRFKEEVASLQERLVNLQSILPSEKETPTLLRSIQDMASSSNLLINKFAPQAMVPRAFYSDWPIQIELEGNYHGLGLFFEKISQATRVIDVGTISIRNLNPQTDPGRTLVASCTATTYVFREEQPAQIEEKERKQ